MKIELSRTPFMEHRWGQRMTCHASVWISGAWGIEGEGRVRDISSSGAFVETATAIPVHARIALAVTGNGSARIPVNLTAIVVRVESAGVGVEWCHTPSLAICTVVGCTARCDA